ncbi:MAG: fumarylacetoacetate hydrolase family protein, partial [Candidatus Bathyarchaeia archaeon]
MKVLYSDHEVYGILEEDWVQIIEGSPFDQWRLSHKKTELSEVKLLPPVLPTKVVGVGLNYKDHAEEVGLEVPKEPVIFLKPPSAVIGPDEPIFLPPDSQRVDYEGELALVVAKPCRDVRLEEAHKYVLGYCCFNDVTARDLQ